jgi:hypothetical protein
MLGELSPTAFARTPEVLEALEEALIACHGDLPSAARRVRVPLRQVHLWTAADPEVYNRVREAQIIGWQALESVAYKRAVRGIKEDVYYQGLVVGQRKVYSDGLLSQLLKARVPAFNTDAAAQQRSPVSVNVNVMPRASSYEEWVTQRQQTLAARESQQPIIEGEILPPTSAVPLNTYNPDDWSL